MTTTTVTEPAAPTATVERGGEGSTTITMTPAELAKLVDDRIAQRDAAKAAADARATGGGRALRSLAIRREIDAARAAGAQACAVFTQRDAKVFLEELDANPDMEPCGHAAGLRGTRKDGPDGYPYTTENGRTVSMNPLDECWSVYARERNISAKMR